MTEPAYFIVPFSIGYVLDLILGDPDIPFHPVRLIGNFINLFEKIYRKIFSKNKKGEILGGIFLCLSVIIAAVFIPFIILYALSKINMNLKLIAEIYFCYSLIAVKSLKTESMKVYYELKNNNLDKAREKLSYIVGRDTENLEKEQIINASIETIAENTSDGVIAPLFYMALGGSLMTFFYKAVNTLDSMVGYKNEKYINFGKFSAKLDDILNFVPSRLSAIFMISASFLLKMDYKNAIKIFKRDRFKHASPNSAQTESACAGALGIRLAGDAYYFGKLYKKEYIGDENKNSEIDDIKKANLLLYLASFIGFLTFLLLRFIIFYIIFKFLKL